MTSPVIHRLEVAPAADGQVKSHSILCIPSSLPTASAGRSQNSGYYNIAMFDVSGSMNGVWHSVLQHWNNEVSPFLTGETDIYTFGTDVHHRRKGTHLTQRDFDCSSTNLAAALRTINDQVQYSVQNNIRVFLITDGHANCGGSPDHEIAQMRVPVGKTVEVYLLGVGQSFPVQYSVDIRSRLHNGSASCPTLFWDKHSSDEEVMVEMKKICEELLTGMAKVKLSIPGKAVPMIKETKFEARGGEYIYYDISPEQLISTLKVTTDDDIDVPVQAQVSVASAKFLVFNLFKQWNAVLIQRHRNKVAVPMGVFEFMRSLFELQINKFGESKSTNLSARLERKHLTNLKLEFAAIMNQGYSIISVESKFQNELQLAEAILKSTVQSRYDTKLLQIKGHGDAEWSRDVQTFKELYTSVLDEVKALPDPSPDDCCRVLMNSFVGDLKDPDFLNVLDLNKMEFLTTMTFTGIPIFAPVKDSAQINPWTLYIKNICVSPFEILSQRALESALGVGVDSSENKEIRLQQSNENSVCNAVVPLIPKEHCASLKKLVKTNVFSVGATFCILKNALIVDHTCHLAALACVWMKTIRDYPVTNRPQFIEKRISDIEATSKIYMDRPGIVNYISALVKDPPQALMTESEPSNGTVLKCESIVKPAYFIHLAKNEISRSAQPSALLKLILLEFLGRCLSSYTSRYPYMDLLVADLDDDKRKEFLAKITDLVLERVHITGQELLKSCYSRSDVEKHIRQSITDATTKIINEGAGLQLEPKPNMSKVERLRNSGSAGHVGWEDLKVWAEEMAFEREGVEPLFSQADVNDAFSPDMVCNYLHHALENRQSKERMSKPLRATDTALLEITKKLKSEEDYFLKSNLLPSVIEAAVDRWQEEYDLVHKEVAAPLTPTEIIARARQLGVDVTESNFSQIYKYRENVKLCRNCCHVEKCPHFLLPNKRFNCHIESERKWDNYPHTLHLVVSRGASESKEMLTEQIKSRSEAGTNNRKKPSPLEAGEDGSILKQVEQLLAQYADQLSNV